jgi:hypothetical protein
MTIIILVKVNDGIVIAADRAGSIISHDKNSDSQKIIKVFYKSKKLFNFLNNIPLGIATYGDAGIGDVSIENIIKDFSEQYSSKININQYYIDDIVDDFISYIQINYGEDISANKSYIGFIVAGYSVERGKKDNDPNIHNIAILKGRLIDNLKVFKGTNAGLAAFGDEEVFNRIYNGYSPSIYNCLKDEIKNEFKVSGKINKIIDKCFSLAKTEFLVPPMPIGDAAELAYFLADLTAKYNQFKFIHSPSVSPTVGGAIEVASITRHENFSWIRRN